MNVSAVALSFCNRETSVCSASSTRQPWGADPGQGRIGRCKAFCKQKHNPHCTFKKLSASMISYRSPSLHVWNLLSELGCCNRIPRTGWLKKQKFIAHSSEAGKPKSKVLAKSAPCLLTVTWNGGEERGEKRYLGSFTSYILIIPPSSTPQALMTSLSLITGLTSNASMCG